MIHPLVFFVFFNFFKKTTWQYIWGASVAMTWDFFSDKYYLSIDWSYGGSVCSETECYYAMFCIMILFGKYGICLHKNI